MKKCEESNTSQALWIAVGNFFSYLLLVLSAAVLSRFLTKQDYGTYRQVLYVYSSFLSLFTLGLPKAYSYFLPRLKKEQGLMFVKKLNKCFLVCGFFFSLFIFVFSSLIATILGNEQLAYNLRLFSPVPMLLLPTMGLEGIMASYKMTYINAIYIVATRFVQLLFVVIPVIVYNTTVDTAVLGLVISSIISYIVASYMKNIPFKDLKMAYSDDIPLKNVLKFSIPLAITAIYGMFISAADKFYISRYYGEEVFADFSNGSLEIPIVPMVLGAAATVLLPLFSKMIIEKESGKVEILNLWRQSAIKATYIIYPLVIYSWFFAVQIMVFLYGSKYAISGTFFRIFLVVNLFTVAQYYPVVLALGKSQYYANVHLLDAIAIWILDFFVILSYPSPYAVAIVSVICRMIKIYLMAKLVASQLGEPIYKLFPLDIMARCFICCVLCASISYLLFKLIPITSSNFVILLMSFSIYILLVYIIGKLFKIYYVELLRPLINVVKKC